MAVGGSKVSLVYDVLAVDRASAVFGKITDSLNKSSLATKALITAAGALSFGKVARETYSFVTAASDVAEAASLTGRIFRESKSEMIEFAEGGAEAFGLSKAATLDAVNEIGNTLQNLGYDMDEAGDHTKTLIGLAGDMASAFNKEVPDALFALQAGLRGEYESLRRFGIFLDELSIKGEAMKQGLYDGTGQMDRQAKAAGALAVILRDTKTIQGDFAMTADGLANSQRILAANLDNLKASMGEGLLPVFEKGVAVLNEMVKAADDLPAPVKTGAVSFALMTSATIALLPMISSVREAMTKMNLTMGQVVARSGKVAGALALVMAALDLIQGSRAIGQLGKDMTEASKTADIFESKMEDLRGKVEGLDAAVQKNMEGWSNLTDSDIDWGSTDDLNFDLIGQLGEAWDTAKSAVADLRSRLSGEGGLAAELERGEQRWASYEVALAKGAEAAGLSINEFSGLEGVSAALNMTTAEGNALTAQGADYLVGIGKAAKEAREGEEEAAEGAYALAQEFAGAAEEGETLLGIMDRLAGKAPDMAAAERDQAMALDELTASLNENGKSFDFSTAKTAEERKAVEENITALDAYRDSVVMRMEAEIENAKVTGDTATAEANVKKIREEGIAEILRQTEATGMSEDQTWALIDAIAEVPEDVWTFIGVDSTKAEERLAVLKAQLKTLEQKHWTTNIAVKVPVGRMKMTYPDGTVDYVNYGMASRGGLVNGPGGPKDDRIPMLLSNNEYVMTAEAVDRIGVDVLHALNRGAPSVVPSPIPGGSAPVGETSVVVMLDSEVLVSALTKAGRNGIVVQA